tara:strand:+ start:24757 stop:25842 length:1086 start_codon:yes stop_codon:yes gene_type:complete
MSAEINIKSKTHNYNVIIKRGSINKKNISDITRDHHKILIITDNGVPKTIISKIKKLIRAPNRKSFLYTIKNGERSKSQKSLFEILNFLASKHFDRSDLIVAVGGGVVGDLSGFVASCYLRGIKYAQIPTTLLSQVDSSVGGKTAINSIYGKNMIGAFYSPKIVIIDPKTLLSLDKRQFRCGMAEVIKYGLIENKTLFQYLNINDKKINGLDLKSLEFIISESIKTKSRIVSLDEYETGIRSLLNYGHTFGHAIETKHDYKKYLHGEAVAIGMVLAARMSVLEGTLGQQEYNSIVSLMKKYNLNLDISKIKYENIKTYLMHDKKISAGRLRFILLNSIGKAYQTDNFKLINLKECFKQHWQ